MRWGVNLAASDRREKGRNPCEVAPSPPPSRPTACSYLLTVTKTFIFFLGEGSVVCGSRTQEPSGGQVQSAGEEEEEEEGVVVQTSLGSHLSGVKRGQSPSEPDSSCCKFMVPPRPPAGAKPHPGYCRNYSRAPWPRAAAAGSTRLALAPYQRDRAGEVTWHNHLSHPGPVENHKSPYLPTLEFYILKNFRLSEKGRKVLLVDVSVA